MRIQDPDILRLTGSCPLSLEEEEAMQRSWAVDPDKCTFILLDKERWRGTLPDTNAMVGDVNLYWNDPDDAGHAEIEVRTGLDE
jgi:hypothetical protein